MEQLEPRLLLTAGFPDVVIMGTAGDDILVLDNDPSDEAKLRVWSKNTSMPSVSFPKSGLRSLAIDGGDGTDSIEVAANVNLTELLALTAETITVSAGTSISAKDVILTANTMAARTVDPVAITSAVLSAVGLNGPDDLLTFDPSTINLQTIVDAIDPTSYLGSIARVTVEGEITATGDVTITAEANNEVGLSASLSDSLLMFRLTEAITVVQGAKITAADGTVTIEAKNVGERGELNDEDKVILNLTIDRASATIEGSTIAAVGVDLTAETAANYAITGAKAIHVIDGATRAEILGDSSVTVRAGGVLVSATEASTVATTSSGNGGFAAAINYIDKDTLALVSNSIVSSAGGSVSILAEGAADLTAKSVIAPPDDSSENPPSSDAYIFTGNIAQGDVLAYIADASVTTTTAGDIRAEAKNSGTITAAIDAVVGSSSDDTRSFGLGVAFNAVGFDIHDVLLKGIGNLMGDPELLGTHDDAGTRAYVSNSRVNAAGSLTIEATNETTVQADLSNRASAPDAAETTTRGASAGMILAMNLLASETVAYVSRAEESDEDEIKPADMSVVAAGMSVVAENAAKIDATVVLGGAGSANDWGVGGVVSFNNVNAGSAARIEDATVELTGGSLEVRAEEAAGITAGTTSEVKTSADGQQNGGDDGDGSSLAVGGTLGINIVQGAAVATLLESSITRLDTTAGDVSVQADNQQTLRATAVGAADVEGGDDTRAVGVTLALNVVGYDAKNALFQTIDALLGESVTSDAFGDDSSAGATASIVDTTVNAAGKVSVTASNASQLTANQTNTTGASSSGTKGGQASSLSLVAAMNKVNSQANAFIDFEENAMDARWIDAGGGVEVTAEDKAEISATLTLGSETATSDGGALGVSGAISLNDVRGGATAFIDHTT
ncbi:MAG: hypothetical protein EA424_13420, partial [Planctomycetaceae bacterium]